MRRNIRARRVVPAWTWLVYGLTLGLAACATLPQGTPEQIVTERAKARWAAVLAGDFESAYGYYSPGYRSSHSLEAFKTRMASSRVAWTGVRLDSLRCQAEVCRPVFYVDYKVTSPLPMVGEIESATRVEEDWLLQEGRWWYVPGETQP